MFIFNLTLNSNDNIPFTKRDEGKYKRKLQMKIGFSFEHSVLGNVSFWQVTVTDLKDFFSTGF